MLKEGGDLKDASDGVGRRGKYRRLTERSEHFQPVRKKSSPDRLVLLCPFSAAKFLQDFSFWGLTYICRFARRPGTGAPTLHTLQELPAVQRSASRKKNILPEQEHDVS